MIEAKHIYKSFDDKEVLHDISTVFEDGKTNLIIGQSGAGKTVLMRTLVGLLTPTKAMCSTMAETSTACRKRSR